MITPPKKDADLKFFVATELVNNPNIGGVAGFTTFAMSIFLMSYWDSKEGSEALVLVAIQIIAYFCINPYLLSLVDWRNYTTEEAEALLHSSVDLYKGLKSSVVLLLLLVIASISYGVLQLSLSDGGLRGGEYFVSMLFDSASLTLPFICFGLYTVLPLEAVQILASYVHATESVPNATRPFFGLLLRLIDGAAACFLDCAIGPHCVPSSLLEKLTSTSHLSGMNY